MQDRTCLKCNRTDEKCLTLSCSEKKEGIDINHYYHPECAFEFIKEMADGDYANCPRCKQMAAGGKIMSVGDFTLVETSMKKVI
jgi:hypothetical protein